jgi:hypothetical protein
MHPPSLWPIRHLSAKFGWDIGMLHSRHPAYCHPAVWPSPYVLSGAEKALRPHIGGDSRPRVRTFRAALATVRPGSPFLAGPTRDNTDNGAPAPGPDGRPRGFRGPAVRSQRVRPRQVGMAARACGHAALWRRRPDVASRGIRIPRGRSPRGRLVRTARSRPAAQVGRGESGCRHVPAPGRADARAGRPSALRLLAGVRMSSAKFCSGLEPASLGTEVHPTNHYTTAAMETQVCSIAPSGGGSSGLVRAWVPAVRASVRVRTPNLADGRTRVRPPGRARGRVRSSANVRPPAPFSSGRGLLAPLSKFH